MYLKWRRGRGEQGTVKRYKKGQKRGLYANVTFSCDVIAECRNKKKRETSR